MRTHKIIATALVSLQTALLIWFDTEIQSLFGFRLWRYCQNTSILGLVLILFARVIHRHDFFKRKEWAAPSGIYTSLGWLIIVAAGSATAWMLWNI